MHRRRSSLGRCWSFSRLRKNELDPYVWTKGIAILKGGFTKGPWDDGGKDKGKRISLFFP